MGFWQIDLRCVCGLPPARIERLGLNAESQFVAHCWCAVCKKNIYMVMDLSDWWRESSSPETDGEPASTGLMREPDGDFLRSMGVRFPDE
jgi:hypothetical protein